MKDKDGFTIRCKHTDWKIYDAQDNHDFVCGLCVFGTLHCYADEKCENYIPDVKENSND